MKFFRLLIVSLAMIICLPVFAQEPSIQGEKAKYNDMNARRRSLFELLEIKPGAIVLLGDNMIDGCEWAELFDNPHIINRGIHGDRVEWMFDRLGAICQAQPAKVFIMAGFQDLLHKTKSKDCVLMIAKLAKTIEKECPNTKIYIMSILPMNLNVPAQESRKESTINLRVDNCNKWLTNWCAGQYITFIDVASAMKDAEGMLDARYTADGINLNGLGYMVWKSVLDPFIAE